MFLRCVVRRSPRRVIELDPLYCDLIIRRFEQATGETATHADLELSFAEVAELRAKEGRHD